MGKAMMLGQKPILTPSDATGLKTTYFNLGRDRRLTDVGGGLRHGFGVSWAMRPQVQYEVATNATTYA